MNTNQTWSEIGKEFRTTIQSSLETGDFSEFNEVVANAASKKVEEVKSQVKSQMKSQFDTRSKVSHTTTQTKKTEAVYQNRRQRTVPQPFFTKVGDVSGTLFQVFGGIGTGITAVFGLLFLVIAGIGASSGFWKAFCVMAVFFLAFLGMIRIGNAKKGRLKRAQDYLNLAGNNHYINIEDLALRTNQKTKTALKDVKRLLKKGFYPQGHLDRQETCLMLDNKIYEEYLSLEKQKKLQEQTQKTEESVTNNSQSVNETEELDTVIKEGRECIRRLRDMNDNIAGEVISAKLFRLENLLKEIFERLQEHPEQTAQMQKFMNYYLPTTLKLVEAYEEFDSLSEQGEDILDAKQEIEKTLDTINSAFAELLNRLFKDAAMDAATDAQVLQTMLIKEGLINQPDFIDRK